MTLYIPATERPIAPELGIKPDQQQQTPTQRVRAAADIANRAFPRPFVFTRLSEEDERLCSDSDMPRIRALAGRRTVNRPALWVDGPMDMFLTALALVSRNVQNGIGYRAKDRLERHMQTDWARERWDAAQKRVADLPSALLSSGGYSTKLMGAGLLGNGLRGKARELNSAVRSDVRNLVDGSHILNEVNTENTVRGSGWGRNERDTTAWTQVDTGTRDLRERVNKLENLKLLMTATGNLRNSDHRANDGHHDLARDTAALIARLGPARADLQFAVGCFENYSLNVSRNSSGYTHTDPGGFMGMNWGRVFSRLATIHQLIREVPGNEAWVDPESDMIRRITFGITGLISFSTLDVICRAPTIEKAVSITTNKSTLEDLLNSPSVSWGDGSSFFFTDGIEVDPHAIRDAIEDPSKVLETRHVETRRVMLRMVGAERIVASTEATFVAEDSFGRLFELPNRTQFVIVQNGTPEADGTRKEYILGAIGQNHTTPRSAVASTFGLKEEQFLPSLQT